MLRRRIEWLWWWRAFEKDILEMIYIISSASSPLLLHCEGYGIVELILVPCSEVKYENDI